MHKEKTPWTGVRYPEGKSKDRYEKGRVALDSIVIIGIKRKIFILNNEKPQTVVGCLGEDWEVKSTRYH